MILHRVAAVIAVVLLVSGCAGQHPGASAPNPKEQERAEDDALIALQKNFNVDYSRDFSQPGSPVVMLSLTSHIPKIGDTKQFDGELAPVSTFTQLGELRLDSCLISGAGFKHLAGLNELRSLTFSSSDVDDSGLKALPVLPKLEAVKLGATKVTDAGFKELRRQPKLKELHFTESAITLKSLKLLSEFPSLTTVDTGGEEHSDEHLSALAAIPKLEKLSFWAHDEVTARGIKALTNCKKLSFLHLELWELDPAALAPLRDLPQLEELHFRLGFVSDKLAQELSEWKNVKRLTLGWTKALTDEGLRSVAKMTQLDSLGLQAAYGLTPDGMKHIATMTNLRALNLWGTKIGEAGVENLKNLTNLRTLVLNTDSKAPITPNALTALAGMKDLEVLDLFDAKISDADLDALAKFTKLKQLDIRGTQITREGAEQLRKKLPQAKIDH
jgi:hypothetical protein